MDEERADSHVNPLLAVIGPAGQRAGRAVGGVRSAKVARFSVNDALPRIPLIPIGESASLRTKNLFAAVVMIVNERRSLACPVSHIPATLIIALF